MSFKKIVFILVLSFSMFNLSGCLEDKASEDQNKHEETEQERRDRTETQVINSSPNKTLPII